MKFHTFFEQHLTVHVGRTCIVSKTPDAHKVEKGGGSRIICCGLNKRMFVKVF